MNLENFPTSESALEMMGWITGNGFYDESYVAKWLFQVMGIEIDQVKTLYDELRDQIFPETTTWGIQYHEQKYGIPTNPALSLEERRAEVIRIRDIRAPMNPARIEQIVKGIANLDVTVTENVAPYTFSIDILTENTTVDYSNIVRTIKKVKPSHLSFGVQFYLKAGIAISIMSQAVAKWPLMAGEDVCGVYPHTSKMGTTSLMNIEADVESLGLKRETYITGTLPDVNMLAAYEEIVIEKSTSGMGAKINYPLAGVKESGIHPAVNTEAEADEVVLVQSTSDKGVKIIYPVTGRNDTGEKPQTSMTGEEGTGGIGTEITGEGIQIIYPLCGEE